MNTFEPRDPNWQQRVRASFSRQPFMEHLGATITHLAPGEVDLTMAFRVELTQQHGFFMPERQPPSRIQPPGTRRCHFTRLARAC